MRCDCLQLGDYITVINGIHTEKLKHDELVTLIKNTGSLIHIQVEFALPPRAPQSAFTVKCKKTCVSLTKDDESIGLVIRGGVHAVSNKSRPLTVTYVRAGGAADRDGIIRSGDRIVTINGVTVISATVEAARRLISESSCVVVIVIEYDIAVMESVQNAEGPLLVEITRSVGSHLGIAVSQQIVQGKSVHIIETVYTGSIAERSGALHAGDHLLAIDGTDLGHMSAAEVEHFLVTGESKVIQLEILPVGHLMKEQPSTISEVPQANPSIAALSCQLNASFYSVFSEEQNPLPLRQASSALSRRRCPPSTAPSHRCTSIRSFGGSGGGQSILCHEETMAVSLFSNHIGLGIVLHSSVAPGDFLDSPPFIGNLVANGSAERCGVIQEGDRVVAINGGELIGYTLDECKHLLDRSKGRCDLVISFDVADDNLPGNSTYQVKLLKRGGTLGISLSGSDSSERQGLIFVSEVKKGSPAYRSGAVHSGDELLSIDNISLSSIQVEDACQILQNTDDVVKLKLRKASKEVSLDATLVFTVEIPKQNNSIGLTISGREQPNHPITISEILPGGMVDRVGALHVGDRIISINGKPLKDQTVSFAIKQLQYGGDLISLTVSRDKDKSGSSLNANPRVQDQHSGQSKDSAVDSWDSQQISPLIQKQGKSNDGRSWNKMISELENLGQMEKNSPSDLTAHSNKQQRSSTSSPHSHKLKIHIPKTPELSTSVFPLTIHIHRDLHETFGFGLSNIMRGGHEGCYIKAVGVNSPAEKGGLRKYDRLLQVNDVDVRSHNCNDIVPIIEVAGTTLTLVVKRSRSDSCSINSGSAVSSQSSSADNISYAQ
ncbi:glutamate receptor-interacting protein 1-like [Watersipora subatra]|uniref:glutamate receptor-interacting protein 1-like n=1 Tax=Watersipora subatra TaxID=2589382 RepID=UPI00355C2C08